MTKYEKKYGILLLIILFVIPIGFYRLLINYGSIGEKPIFPFLALWCASLLVLWLIALFFLALIDRWNAGVDQSWNKWGFSQLYKIKIIWVFVILSSLLFVLFFMITLIDRPPLGQEFFIQRILAIMLGGIPIISYDFFRAGQLTKHILEGKRFVTMEEFAPYIKTKWRYALIIGITVILTPFFGIGTIIGDLWKYMPKKLKIVIVPTILFVSFIIATEFLSPLLVKQGNEPVAKGLSLALIINLFGGVAYVLLWKAVLLRNLYRQY